MHYLDEGSGPPVLLLHGEPTWSYLYRNDHPRADAVGARDRARLLRLRPLGQAAPPGGLHLRLPRRLDRAARRGARPARPDGRRPGLGRADRPPPRGRAPRPRRAARDHEHRHRRRTAAVRRVAALPRLPPPRRHRPDPRQARAHLGRAADERRGRGRLQRAVAGARVEGGHPRVPRPRPDLARPSGPAGAPSRARRSSPSGRSPRSSSSRTPIRSSRRAPRSGSPSTSPARSSPRSSRARATSCRRTGASRSAAGSPVRLSCVAAGLEA